MSRSVASLRAHARIADQCPVFKARLHPLWEEGFPLHQMHYCPQPIHLGTGGIVRPMMDPRLATVFGVQRMSPLLPYMERSLRGLKAAPPEMLLVEIPVADATLPFRVAMVDEVSEILTGVMDGEELVQVVTVSHRRCIHGSMVVRHHLVALFDGSGAMLWCHPAAAEYGFIRPGFPEHQQIRALGKPNPPMEPDQIPRRLDPATGLPLWFLRARQQHPDLFFEQSGWDIPRILSRQAELWVAHGVVDEPEVAFREALQDFIQGVECFFGAGGLHPTPTLFLP